MKAVYPMTVPYYVTYGVALHYITFTYGVALHYVIFFLALISQLILV